MRITSLTLGLLVLVAGSITLAQRPAPPMKVMVYKSPTCGCCSKWIDHMRQAGFTVQSQDLPAEDVAKRSAKLGVPESARSCHTAQIGKYIVEGHVPASDVKRMLKDRPKNVVGLSAPGMPLGSPGMETPGVKAPPYDVVSFDAKGKTKVFSTHKP